VGLLVSVVIEVVVEQVCNLEFVQTLFVVVNFVRCVVLDVREESVLRQLSYEHWLDQLLIAVRTSGRLVDSHDEGLVEELWLRLGDFLALKEVLPVNECVL